LVATVVNLHLTLVREELNRRWVRAGVVAVKASAVKKVAFANWVALALLPLLSGVRWASQNRPLRVNLILVNTALEAGKSSVTLTKRLRELELSHNSVIWAST